ncbi:MAG: DUF1549 and DUF1553 domain-containing protein [Akkermansiaceae bacterium]
MVSKLPSRCLCLWLLAMVASLHLVRAADGEGETYWAYQKPQKPAVPEVAGNTSPNPIDAFIAAGLAEQTITPNPAAKPRQLLRRLSYDLTGLPPSAAQSRAFIEKTSSGDIPADHWQHTVDQFLASPHYGEKLASLWLDTVRYAETNGYERDSVKPEIWRYRDYVINAFNQDLPYDRFLTEQLAGDEIPQPTLSSSVATGFLALMLRDDEPADRPQAHADMISDIVDVTGEAFLGITLNCAKCHDHKGDPILQADYYSMRAFFEPIQDSTLKAANAHFKDPTIKSQSEAEIKSAEAELARLWTTVDKNKLIALATPAADSSHQPQQQSQAIIPFAYDGFHVSWQVSHKKPSDPGWSLPSFSGKGFTDSGLPLRHGNPGPEFGGTAKPWNPKHHTLYLRRDFGLTTIPERFVVYTRGTAERITVLINGTTVYSGPAHTSGKLRYYPFKKSDMTHLTTGKNTIGLVVHSPKPHKYLNLAIFPHLFHPVSPELYAEHFPAELAALYGEGFSNQFTRQINRIKAARQRLVHKGIPYMTQLERPDAPKSHIHHRGSVHSPTDEVFPAVPLVLAGSAESARIPITGDYNKTGTHGRRLALAKWIASKDNPLTARVMVNRLWQHCFGTGIVPLANDFGVFGGNPSNQALLDWLAVEFMESGWSIKHMMRLMLTSDTYRRSSAPNETAAQADPLNKLHWKHNPRRLSAEEIRDTFLSLSNELRLQKPSQPFIRPKMPEAVLATSSKPKEVWPATKGPEANCRSVYIHVKRSIQLPMLSAFDAPQRDISCPTRFATTVPTQTLTMLNSGFVNERAAIFASKLESQHPENIQEQLNNGFLSATGRAPADSELDELSSLQQDLLSEYKLNPSDALTRICLLLLNLNETIYLD